MYWLSRKIRRQVTMRKDGLSKVRIFLFAHAAYLLKDVKMGLPDVASSGEPPTFYKMFHVEHFVYKVPSYLVVYLFEVGSTYTIFAHL